MREYKLYLPPLEIQKQIVRKLSLVEIDVLLIIDKNNEKLNNLEELKKSILQKAFAGELTNKTVEV